jgi:hypothetical protein
MANTVDEGDYDEIFGLVTAWQEGWNRAGRPYLGYRKSWSTVVIDDYRNRPGRTHTFSDGRAALYEYCSDARTRNDVGAQFNDAAWIDEALDEFVDRDLIAFLDGRYLSLALPENPYL